MSIYIYEDGDSCVYVVDKTIKDLSIGDLGDEYYIKNGRVVCDFYECVDNTLRERNDDYCDDFTISEYDEFFEDWKQTLTLLQEYDADKVKWGKGLDCKIYKGEEEVASLTIKDGKRCYNNFPKVY